MCAQSGLAIEATIVCTTPGLMCRYGIPRLGKTISIVTNTPRYFIDIDSTSQNMPRLDDASFSARSQHCMLWVKTTALNPGCFHYCSRLVLNKGPHVGYIYILDRQAMSAVFSPLNYTTIVYSLFWNYYLLTQNEWQGNSIFIGLGHGKFGQMLIITICFNIVSVGLLPLLLRI